MVGTGRGGLYPTRDLLLFMFLFKAVFLSSLSCPSLVICGLVICGLVVCGLII